MKVKSKNKKEKRELFKRIAMILLFSILLLVLIESTKWLYAISFKILTPLEDCFVKGNEVCILTVIALSITTTILTEFAVIIIPGVVLIGLFIREKIKKKKISNVESSLKIAACIAFVVRVLIEKISSF